MGRTPGPNDADVSGRAARGSPAALRTYTFLRLGMVAATVALGVSVVIEVAGSHGCVQQSISAYYYTPTRAVFVGVLVTLGVSMVVLWGRHWVEDTLLNLAGMVALVVAFVPTADVNLCSVPAASRQAVGDNPARLVTTAPIDNNVVTLGLLVLAVLVAVMVVVNTGSGWVTLVHSRPGAWYADPGFYVSYGLALLLWVVGAAVFILQRSTFDDYAHEVSGAILFVCVIGVVLTNAWDTWHHSRRGWTVLYTTVAVLLVLAGGGIFAAGNVLPDTGFGRHWQLITESALITLFDVFWVAQTVDRRDEQAPVSRSLAGTG